MAHENSTNLLSDLEEIKNDIKFIKEHMIDIDTILTADDRIAIATTREEFKQGKTISLKNLKKELDI